MALKKALIRATAPSLDEFLEIDNYPISNLQPLDFNNSFDRKLFQLYQR